MTLLTMNCLRQERHLGKWPINIGLTKAIQAATAQAGATKFNK